ncbi:FAD-binding domain-containing protein 17 [Elsinoe fawcettii]|nr:FAD-binding domain-containing protein 17 [Elsinoe fawcettii]
MPITNGESGHFSIVVDVDVLIVGAGPSGSSLACFLGKHGVKGLMVSHADGPIQHPRSIYTNMGGMECLRELGLEERISRIGRPVSDFTYTRFCKTLVGEEIYRGYLFGSDPQRHGDYDDASPSKSICITQDELEPMLLQFAANHGFPTRWQTTLLHVREDKIHDVVYAEVRDATTGTTYSIRAKQLIAADGSNSQVVKDLELPLVHGPGNGFTTAVWIEADLTHLVKSSPGLLNYLVRPDKPAPPYGVMGNAHIVKPWNEWAVALFPHPQYKKMEATEEQLIHRVKELLGDETLDIKVKGIHVWNFEEVYAERYSQNNVHCLGDAVHRHPPFGGLGTSTCIQDAYNLAWKLAFVLQGKAHKSLLNSYNDERQPVGMYVVERTNENGRMNKALYAMLGFMGPGAGPEKQEQVHTLLRSPGPEGEAMRTKFRQAIRGLDDERHGLGAVMNQWYRSSALYTDDESDEPEWPATESDRAKKLYTGSYPGWRLPHVWLRVPRSSPGPQLPLVSTRDVTGHGRFALLTGIGGKETWQSAAELVRQSIGVDIAVFSIGMGQDYDDVFFKWYDVRGVEEEGAVLVRPDRTVAWRTQIASDDAADKLVSVTRSILGLK